MRHARRLVSPPGSARRTARRRSPPPQPSCTRNNRNVSDVTNVRIRRVRARTKPLRTISAPPSTPPGSAATEVVVSLPLQALLRHARARRRRRRARGARTRTSSSCPRGTGPPGAPARAPAPTRRSAASPAPRRWKPPLRRTQARARRVAGLAQCSRNANASASRDALVSAAPRTNAPRLYRGSSARVSASDKQRRANGARANASSPSADEPERGARTRAGYRPVTEPNHRSRRYRSRFRSFRFRTFDHQQPCQSSSHSSRTWARPRVDVAGRRRGTRRKPRRKTSRQNSVQNALPLVVRLRDLQREAEHAAVLLVERVPAQRALAQSHAQRPDVRRASVRQAFDALRAHVPQRPLERLQSHAAESRTVCVVCVVFRTNSRSCVRPTRILAHSRRDRTFPPEWIGIHHLALRDDAEVGDLAHAGPAHQPVSGLDVAVHQPLFLQVLQPAATCAQTPPTTTGGSRAPPNSARSPGCHRPRTRARASPSRTIQRLRSWRELHVGVDTAAMSCAHVHVHELLPPLAVEHGQTPCCAMYE